MVQELDRKMLQLRAEMTRLVREGMDEDGTILRRMLAELERLENLRSTLRQRTGEAQRQGQCLNSRSVGKTSGIGTKSPAGFDSTTLVSAAGALPSADLGPAFSVAAKINPKSTTNDILAVIRIFLRAILRLSPSLN